MPRFGRGRAKKQAFCLYSSGISCKKIPPGGPCGRYGGFFLLDFGPQRLFRLKIPRKKLSLPSASGVSCRKKPPENRKAFVKTVSHPFPCCGAGDADEINSASCACRTFYVWVGAACSAAGLFPFPCKNGVFPFSHAACWRRASASCAASWAYSGLSNRLA